MLFSIPKCVVAVGYVTERASSCPINYSAPTIQVFHWKSFRVTDLTRSGSGKVGQYKSWSSFFSVFLNCWSLICLQHAGDAEVESLGKLQLKQFTTNVDMQSDGSLTVHVSLASCELDDTRPCRHVGITRFLAVVLFCCYRDMVA